MKTTIKSFIRFVLIFTVLWMAGFIAFGQQYCIPVTTLSVYPDSQRCAMNLAWNTTGCQWTVIHYDGQPVIYAGDSIIDAGLTAWYSPIPLVSGTHFYQFDGYPDNPPNPLNKVSSVMFMESYTANCTTKKHGKKK